MPTPKGIITLWYYTQGAIPTNWGLCDGSTYAGTLTPDLRDSFVRGASIDADLGASGGANSHSHSSLPTVSNGGGHSHSVSGGTNNASTSSYSTAGTLVVYGAGGHSHSWGGSTDSDDTHSHTGGGNSTENNIPPYYKTFYIMKINDV